MCPGMGAETCAKADAVTRPRYAELSRPREQNVAKISTFYAAQPVPPPWSVETALA